MSSDLSTKYLYIDYIFQGRILFAEQPIIVNSTLGMDTLYDTIARKLSISVSDRYFKLFCNSKICTDTQSGDNTLQSIFGIDQYKITVLLTREYFEFISKMGPIAPPVIQPIMKREIVVKYNRFTYTTTAVTVKELQDNLEARYDILPHFQKIIRKGKIISDSPSQSFDTIQPGSGKIKVKLLNETPVETSSKKQKSVDKPVPSSLEDFEISWDNYKEQSSINDKYEEFVNINTNMATCFIRCKIVEDYNVVKAMKDVDLYINKIGLDMPNSKLDLLDTLQDEIHNKFYMDEKPFMTYYARAYSLELLKARLTHPRSTEDTRFLQQMVNLLEQYGIDIGHPSCIAEQEFRSLITGDPEILTQFLEYIKTTKNVQMLHKISMLNSHTAILDPIDGGKDYLKKMLDSEQRQFSPSRSNLMTAGGISKDIDEQIGGDARCFQKIHNLLELEGEPKHDFGDGSKRCQLAEHILRPDGIWHHGTASGENKDIDKIYKDLSTNINTKPVREVISQTSHEPKLFNHYATNNSYHLTGTNKSINSRFKFFKFDSHSPVDNPAVIWDQSTQYAIPDYQVHADRGLNYFKTLLKDNGVKHFLFDTFGIDKSTAIKNCMWDGADASLDIPVHNGPMCDGPGITKITPLVNLWDPASTSRISFERTLNIARDWDKREAGEEGIVISDDVNDTSNSFAALVKSVFIGKNDTLPAPVGEYRPDRGWDISDTDLLSWWPIRADLSEYYEVKFRPDYTTRPLQLILKNPRNKTIHRTIPLQQGFSVDQLTIIMASVSPPPDQTVAGRRKQAELLTKIRDIKSDAVQIDLTAAKNAFDEWEIDPVIKIKILLDMKKSGDWSLVKWTYIVNKFFAQDHKTILLSADKLCALFGILNDIPVLFGSSSLTLIKKEDGSLSNMEAKLMGYYSGSDTPLTLEDINKDLRYIINQLFKGPHEPPITPEVFLETWTSEIFEDTPIIEYIVTRLNDVSELFTDEIIAKIFKTGGIFVECCKSIQLYEAGLDRSPVDRLPDTTAKDAIEIMREISEILNSIEKYSKAGTLGTHDIAIGKMLNTMVALTVVHSYTGTINTKYGSIKRSSLGPNEIKRAIINDVTKATGMSVANIWDKIGRTNDTDRGGRIEDAAGKIGRIKDTIRRLITPDEEGTEDISVEYTCNRLFNIAEATKPIFTAQGPGQDETVLKEKSERMSFFLKDMSNIMSIFFEFPIINHLFIEIPQLVASIPGTINDKINSFMANVKGGEYVTDSYWDPKVILNITTGITDKIFSTIPPGMARDINGLSKIYNCFSSIFNNSHNNIFSIGSMVDSVQIDADDDDEKEKEKDKLTDILVQLDTTKSHMSVLAGLVQPVISKHHKELMEQYEKARLVGDGDKMVSISEESASDTETGGAAAATTAIGDVSIASAHHPANSVIKVKSIVGIISPTRANIIVGYGYITKKTARHISVRVLTEYIEDSDTPIPINYLATYESEYYRAVSLPIASTIGSVSSIKSQVPINAHHRPVKINDLVTILRTDMKTVAGLGIIHDAGKNMGELKVYVLTSYVDDTGDSKNMGEYISYEAEYFRYITKEQIVKKKVTIQSKIEPTT
jgi:hypothetical protein